MALIVLALVCVVCVGVVNGQCGDDQLQPVAYSNEGEFCDIESGGVDIICKNFMSCRPSTDLAIVCTAPDKKDDFDFPYGEICTTDAECGAPMICASSTCDYINLINGYKCESDSQCDSNICFGGVCTASGDIVSDGFADSCVSDSDCDRKNFCDSDSTCVPSLKDGENCTDYSDSTMEANRVCKPGSACLPVSEEEPRCQKTFSFKHGDHCGNNPYACAYGLYCDSTSQKCATMSVFSGDAPSCTSTNSSDCPFGYLCSCAGEIEDSNSDSICKSFFNAGCSSTHSKYLSCLAKHDCPFDPFTLIHNPDSSIPSDFVGPLNRFSCAANKCGDSYIRLVKCQNNGFGSDRFSPAYRPAWARISDSNWEGWQIALIVVSVLVAISIIVAIVFMVKRSPRSYDQVEYDQVE